LKNKTLITVGKKNLPEYIAASLKGLTEVIYVSPSDKKYNELLEDAAAAVIGMEKVGCECLDRALKLKIIARFGVGYDNIDIEACSRRGIIVTHTPGVLSGAVADLTWALILSLSRGIVKADRFTRKNWAKSGLKPPLGRELKGKTLGIFGLGRIGLEVAMRAQGFGAKVIYHDIIMRKDFEEKLKIKYVGFKKLLKLSDVISIHVPLLPTTRRIIGKKELELMKPSAILINTSRGPIVDQEALVEALEKKRIGGAGLDVFEEEPLPSNDRLANLDNVILTPHIGSATVETRRKMAAKCIKNVKAFFEGRKPPDLVPEQKTCFQ